MLSNPSTTPTMGEVVQSRASDDQTAPTRPIRVFLVDDHEIVRDGLRAVIDATDDLEVVGEASTVADAITRLDSSRPDVAVVDLFLPDGDGVQVCRESRSRRPELHCLILTSFSDDEALFDAIMAGAAGYVLKGARSGELLDSIRQVAAGRSLLDPAVTARVFEMFRTGRETDRRLASLSQQERRVLDLLSEGLTNRQIATKLNLAEKTVKNYVSNLLMKMGFRRRTEAATYAARLAERRTRRAPAPLATGSQVRR
jgi:DNA-binding NarL/FixJ family response regulator